MKKALYLPIEIKFRELFPKLLIAFFAAKKGFFSVLGDKEGVHRAIRYFGEGIYFDKSISMNKFPNFENLKKKNIKIICQDEEAGFNKIKKKYIDNFFKNRVTEKNLNIIEQFYCWGKFDYEELRKKHIKNKKKIILTGSARTDFWNKKFISKIFKNEIKEIKKKYKNFILIPTSFGITSKLEKIRKIKNLKNMKYLTKKKEIIKKKIKFDELYENFNEFCELIEFISKKKPSQKIVIRPHFAENKKDWIKRFEKFKNVRVENEGDISQWIAAAEYIIHSGSTTGIQSHIMDKKVLLYYTKATKKRENAFPNNFGKKCANKYQILKNLDIKKSKKNNTSLVSKRILIDNNFASKKIVSNLSKIKIIKSNKYKFLTPSILNLYFLKHKISFLRGELPKSQRVLRTYNEKMPNGIKLNEVKEFLEKLISYFNLQKLIKIRHCGPNCFLIYNKNI